MNGNYLILKMDAIIHSLEQLSIQAHSNASELKSVIRITLNLADGTDEDIYLGLIYTRDRLTYISIIGTDHIYTFMETAEWLHNLIETYRREHYLVKITAYVNSYAYDLNYINSDVLEQLITLAEST